MSPVDSALLAGVGFDEPRARQHDDRSGEADGDFSTALSAVSTHPEDQQSSIHRHGEPTPAKNTSSSTSPRRARATSGSTGAGAESPAESLPGTSARQATTAGAVTTTPPVAQGVDDTGTSEQSAPAGLVGGGPPDAAPGDDGASGGAATSPDGAPVTAASGPVEALAVPGPGRDTATSDPAPSNPAGAAAPARLVGASPGGGGAVNAGVGTVRPPSSLSAATDAHGSLAAPSGARASAGAPPSPADVSSTPADSGRAASTGAQDVASTASATMASASAATSSPASAPASAPSPAGPPPLPTPPPTPAQQVVTVLAPLRSSPDGTHELTIGLEPEDLGTVKATVTVSAGQVVVQLGADNDQARDALRQALPLLRNELGGDGSSATVLLSGDGRQGRQAFPHAPSSTGSGSAEDADTDQSTATATAAPAARRGHNIDLRL